MARQKKTFVNPFHFIPPAPMVEAHGMADVRQTLLDRPSRDEPFEPAAPELLHDRYLAEGAGGKDSGYYSGRIVCRLTTKSPCVFGNEHRTVTLLEDGRSVESTIVDNFSLDGYAAIAGTTLKGMLGTLAEMASGSAMRVLKNRVFSVRSSMQQSRSALGMVIVDQGRRKILPLTLPTFSRSKDGSGFKPTYHPHQQENELWHTILEQRRAIDADATMTPAYLKKDVKEGMCFHKDKQVVALSGESLPGIVWDFKRHRPAERQPQEVMKGRNVIRPIKLQPLPKVEGIGASPQQTLGIVRKLRNPGGDVSSGQDLAKPTFALFIPIPARWATADGRYELPDADRSLLLDAEDACRVFDAIVAHEYSNAPDDPACTSLTGQSKFVRKKKRGKRGGKKPALRDGDLVFFRPDSTSQVGSVGISSIWREGVRWLWDDATGEPDLLDSIDRHPMHIHRSQVSMAEKMFGWVADEGKVDEPADDQISERWVSAYKGRVRVSDAVSVQRLEEVQLKKASPAKGAPAEVGEYFPLKILASPKPPCPEFYMAPGGQPERIRQDFPQRPEITIQGWKFYVLNPATWETDNSHAWETRHADKHLEQKSWVRPVRCGTDFWFHVDFENLTSAELQLLCYALRPAPGFVHRCGFGRPLGLGAVQIEPLVVAYIDRCSRYRSHTGLLRKSYRYSQTLGHISQLQQAPLPPRHDDYQRIMEQSAATEGPSSPFGVVELANRFARMIGEQHQRIRQIGTLPELPPDCVGITYPHAEGQEGEEMIFKWFTNNRDNRGKVEQWLRPLDPTSPLPALDVNRERRRP